MIALLRVSSSRANISACRNTTLPLGLLIYPQIRYYERFPRGGPLVRGLRENKTSTTFVTTAARLNSARFQATIYSTSCVSYSPPTCSSSASCCYLLRLLFGDFSFPFFPFLLFFSSPLLSFPLLIKGHALRVHATIRGNWRYVGCRDR